jgi:hypothetical protein
MAQEYATRHDLDLDTDLRFEDLGVSAFRGANAEAGRLADVLEAVRVGQVPRGSLLLVEALDRISRLNPETSLRENPIDLMVARQAEAGTRSSSMPVSTISSSCSASSSPEGAMRTSIPPFVSKACSTV